MPTIASMTGYGVATGKTPVGVATVECRSVNSRFLDLSLRVCEELRFVEPVLREALQKRLTRGKVEVRVTLRADEAAAPTALHADVLSRMLALQTTILQAAPDAKPLSVAEILALPGVAAQPEASEDNVRAAVVELFERAFADFLAARTREGESLKHVFLKNCENILEIVGDVEKRMPEIHEHLRTKLQERLETALSEALTEKSTLSREEVSDRIRQEVTLYALRMDVSEEINRLRTHVREVRATLDKGGVVGRRLDFMTQEMNREANTLGSKAAAIEMTQASIALKLNIDQMREQLQNLE